MAIIINRGFQAYEFKLKINPEQAIHHERIVVIPGSNHLKVFEDGKFGQIELEDSVWAAIEKQYYYFGPIKNKVIFSAPDKKVFEMAKEMGSDGVHGGPVDTSERKEDEKALNGNRK